MVARCVRDAEVPGSNPGSPTTNTAGTVPIPTPAGAHKRHRYAWLPTGRCWRYANTADIVPMPHSSGRPQETPLRVVANGRCWRYANTADIVPMPHPGGHPAGPRSGSGTTDDYPGGESNPAPGRSWGRRVAGGARWPGTAAWTSPVRMSRTRWVLRRARRVRTPSPPTFPRCARRTRT